VGTENVSCVVMPSPHSSDETQADARAIAANLGAEAIEIPIEAAMEAYGEALEPSLSQDGVVVPESLPRDPARPSEPDLAAENIQARIRGNLMMALSNKHGWLVLTTGNKSEMSVGYATLYGDMAGGFAAIKDVPKTLVYEIAGWRNANGPGEPPIPERIMTKPPTAELRLNQLDTDSLPPYETLDPIIEAYVEDDLDEDAIVARGFDRATVERVARMIDRAEYKRRQAAPGVKITPKAFGRDRRLPITNRYGST
jgi:NAD+ synthase (glutamine-hydrolysing)